MRNKSLLILTISAMAIGYFTYPSVKNAYSTLAGSSEKLEDVRQRVTPKLAKSLAASGLVLGAQTYIRIFKEERELELWLEADQQYKLFKTYPICNYSGDLGSKLKEGDRQSPEGFYNVGKSAMNPNSSYHLSFNLGFPNIYDQSHARTGSFLMIHGNCVSIGCYAMTDSGIEEIYLITEAAQNAGQETVPVHAFPFRMTSERLKAEINNPWYPFWANLKVGYDLFEKNVMPPLVSVSEQEYVFEG